MNPIRAIYIAILAVLAIAATWDAWGGPLDETRYCTITPTRDADGSISRRADVLRAFRDLYPCPATGNKTGACLGWNIDHVIPLACGGCDAVANLQWLPVQIKRCAGQHCKDRWERNLYCITQPTTTQGATPWQHLLITRKTKSSTRYCARKLSAPQSPITSAC